MIYVALPDSDSQSRVLDRAGGREAIGAFVVVTRLITAFVGWMAAHSTVAARARFRGAHGDTSTSDDELQRDDNEC